MAFNNNIDVYHKVNSVYERVVLTCQGVFFEIIVEPRQYQPVPDPEAIKRHIVHPVNIDKGEYNIDINLYGAQLSPVLKAKLRRIERLQDNYNILLDTLKVTLEDLRAQYSEADFKTTIRRHRQQQPEPVPEAELEAFSDEAENINKAKADEGEQKGDKEPEKINKAKADEGEQKEDKEPEKKVYEEDEEYDTDSEIDWESDSDVDWETDSEYSDADSCLGSETDTQSELEFDSDIGSESDSGMD